MTQNSIRLVRTPDVDKVISYLRDKYALLSEAEVIKLALSEKYQKEKEMTEYKDYRVFSKEQIDEWVKEDQLPEPLASKTAQYWSSKIK